MQDSNVDDGIGTPKKDYVLFLMLFSTKRFKIDIAIKQATLLPRIVRQLINISHVVFYMAVQHRHLVPWDGAGKTHHN